MARQLEHFDNLVAMFLTRAAEKGDKPFLWAKRDGEWRADQLGRGGAPGRGAGGVAEAHRPRAGRPRVPGQREPARMADRRPWDHGRGLRHRPDLHHQHHARSRAHPRQFRRPRGHRLEPEAGEEPHPGGADLDRMPSCDRHRGNPLGPGPRLGDVPQLDGAGLGRAGRRRAKRRSQTSVAAISPASSTPAAPAERRAASS